MFEETSEKIPNPLPHEKGKSQKGGTDDLYQQEPRTRICVGVGGLRTDAQSQNQPNADEVVLNTSRDAHKFSQGR